MDSRYISGKLSANRSLYSQFDPCQKVSDPVDWNSLAWDLDPVLHLISRKETSAIYTSLSLEKLGSTM